MAPADTGHAERFVPYRLFHSCEQDCIRLRATVEEAQQQALNAANDMWKAVERAEGLEEVIARTDEHVAALRSQVEELTKALEEVNRCRDALLFRPDLVAQIDDALARQGRRP